MNFDFQLPIELTAAHGIRGKQALRRGIFYKYQNPLRNLPEGKHGSVICQVVGTPEAPCVISAEFIDNLFSAG